MKDLEKRIKKLEHIVGLTYEKDELPCIGCSAIHNIAYPTSGFTCQCGAKWSKDKGWERTFNYRVHCGCCCQCL